MNYKKLGRTLLATTLTIALFVLWVWFSVKLWLFFAPEPPEHRSLLNLIWFALWFVVWIAGTFTGLRVLYRNISACKGKTYKWLKPSGLLLSVTIFLFGVFGGSLGVITIVIELANYLSQQYELTNHLYQHIWLVGVVSIVLIFGASFLIVCTTMWLDTHVEILKPQQVTKK